MYKLLIAEDELLSLLGIQSLIPCQELNISAIITASNGQDAIDKIRTDTPDIVLLDITMPIKNGITVLEEIYQSSSTTPLFIILTNSEDFHYAKQALRLGVFDYINKSELSAQYLYDVLKNALLALPAKSTITENSAENLHILQHVFFSRLLINTFSSLEELKESAQSCGLSLDNNFYAVLYAGIEDVPSERTLSIRSFLTQALDNFFSSYYVLSHPPGSYIIIIYVPDETALHPNYLTECCQHISKLVLRYVNKVCRIGIGHPVSAQTSITNSFSESVYAYEYCKSNNCTTYVSPKITTPQFFSTDGKQSDDRQIDAANNIILINIKKYIDLYYHLPLTLVSVAEHFKYSTGYISNIFSQYNNVTFSEYITSVRMKNALRLLAETQLPVSEVAEQCGYNDAYYFSRIFKKRFHISPRNYQLQHQSNIPLMEQDESSTD